MLDRALCDIHLDGDITENLNLNLVVVTGDKADVYR